MTRPDGEHFEVRLPDPAMTQLLPGIYDELRRAAGSLLRSERRDHTLQPTALVHEAFLRLQHQEKVTPTNRAELLGVAALMMRRILVDHARRRSSRKRGGDLARLTLTDCGMLTNESQIDVIELDRCLARLAELEPRQARVVELRFFGGLGVEEVAAVLEVSPRTVDNDWRFARAWLRRELDAERE